MRNTQFIRWGIHQVKWFGVRFLNIVWLVSSFCHLEQPWTALVTLNCWQKSLKFIWQCITVLSSCKMAPLAIDRKLPRLFWLRTELRFWIGWATTLTSTLSRICGLKWRIKLPRNIHQVLKTLWKWLKKCGWKKSPKNSAKILCTVCHSACKKC